jgi:voltage-gated potassium channel
MRLVPHNHPARILWNCIVLVGVLIFLFAITYRLVFGDFTADGLYYLLIALFTADIALNFFTQVKSGHIRLERQEEIAARYLRSWFAVDAIAALPIEMILIAVFGAFEPQSRFNAAHLLLQTVTLVKLFKAVRIFNEFQESIGLLPAVRRLLFFGYWLAVIMHLIALGWVLIGASETQRSPLDQYLRDLYWTTTTIATIGYGDYYPNHDSNVQIIYTIAIELFGAAMFSYVIANVSSLVSNLDVARSAYRHRLDEVNAFLRSHRIPLDLQERIRDYYSYLWVSQRGVRTSSVLEDFPRNLSQEILLFLNRELLDRVELFRGADELFIREAVQLLTPAVFLPGEYIIRQGEYGDCMYFLAGGEVRILVNGNEVARLGPGSPFGETALVENLHRNASVVSVGYGTGYRLSKSDFDGLRAKYPVFDSQVREVVERRKKN